MSREAFLNQYDQTWKILEATIDGYDSESWIHLGLGYMTPVKVAFHILKGFKYYMREKSVIEFPSGVSLESDLKNTSDEDLPSQKDMLICLQNLKGKSADWLSNLDLDGNNETFPWAGKSNIGVVIFLLRHTLFHMGELNSLLFVKRDGNLEDNWMMGFSK
ncbi:MAG: hypothetical protein HN368_19375 [Spirochaetales bacterium]|nr:hypothetical protein [Spirochaetales bacterium]